jgi:uncharacterized protein (TIGR03435 family)
VSVKQNTSHRIPWSLSPPTGMTYTATNVPLRLLIMIAYQVKDFQLVDAPGWIVDRYDVVAKTKDKIQPKSLWPMLQTLLEDRFQLRVHREIKQLPVYALVVAKAGKLHQSEDCSPTAQLPSPEPGKALPAPAQLPSPEPGKAPPAGIHLPAPCGAMVTFPSRLFGRKISSGFLANALSTYTERIVLDKTGLKGQYDITLHWRPDPGVFLSGPGGIPLDVVDPEPPDPNGPSLFTAIQEQLGLKLKSQTGPVQVLVIDHVEKPSEN